MIRGCTNGSGGSNLSVREEAAAPQDNLLRSRTASLPQVLLLQFSTRTATASCGRRTADGSCAAPPPSPSPQRTAAHPTPTATPTRSSRPSLPRRHRPAPTHALSSGLHTGSRSSRLQMGPSSRNRVAGGDGRGSQRGPRRSGATACGGTPPPRWRRGAASGGTRWRSGLGTWSSSSCGRGNVVGRRRAS